MQKPVDDSASGERQRCLDEQEIVDFAAGLVPADKLPLVEEHLSGCDKCMALIATAAPHVSSTAQITRSVETQPFAEPFGEPLGQAFGERKTTPSSSPSHGRNRPLLAPGTPLDTTYQVVRFLGRGGMGDVYEVKHARLAGRYAAKLLSSDLVTNAQAFSRFQREAMIASGLSHPNIVNVIDFCHLSDGLPCLVMEFLDGVDLAQVMSQGPLSPARTLRLVRQIVSALSTLHGHQIIHRDLKPQNIFVLPESDGEPERVKLVDFGLAKRSNPSMVVTHDRTLLGTPQYMAPEQAIGSADGLGPESDQFSLAAIVYEMLGGRHPFGGEVLSTVLYRIVHEPPAPLGNLAPHVPPHVVAAIERGLAKDRLARFPSVKAFLQALEGEGPAMTPALSSSPSPQRRPWLFRPAVLASAGVLAVAVGIVSFVRARARAPEPAIWRASEPASHPTPGGESAPPSAASSPSPTGALAPSDHLTIVPSPGAPAAPGPTGETSAPDKPAVPGARPVVAAKAGKPATPRPAGKAAGGKKPAAHEGASYLKITTPEEAIPTPPVVDPAAPPPVHPPKPPAVLIESL